jgi:hypothetical protein
LIRLYPSCGKKEKKEKRNSTGVYIRLAFRAVKWAWFGGQDQKES